jgi:aminoacrylate hydrolase
MPILTLKAGGHLHYEVHGSGPPLMVFNNLGGLSAFWQPHIAAFAKRFTIVLHDHRGAGKSSLDEIRFSVDQMADDALELADHLKIERFDVVGHSTGGAMGLTVAITRPERINRLFACSTWPGTDPYFDLLFHARTLTIKHLGPEEYVRQTTLIGRPPQWLRDHPEDTAPPKPEVVKAMIPSPQCLIGRIAALRAFDRRSDLHRVKCPTFLTCAADDMVTPVHLTRELITAIPHAQSEILDWGGHFYPVIRPEILREQVLSFFA